ncbi:MAG: transcriptional regulator [archaeon]|nr:transcriptional regulator [archaeon]
MEKDQAIGAIILIASILGIIIYGWLLFFFGAQISLLVLQITVFIAAVAILAILAWIGWTMATTPPPKPIEPELTPTTTPGQMPKEEK